MRADGGKGTLVLLFLGGRRSGLGGLSLGHALLEFIDAAGGIHKFLLAGEEGMAGITYTHDNHRLGGAGLDHVAASATDLRIHILWMYLLFHKRDVKIAPPGT